MAVAQTIRRYLRYTSWPIIAAMVALMIIGATAIGVSERAAGGSNFLVKKQVIFGAVGLAAFFVATIISYRKLGQLSYVLFGLTLGLLVVVFFLPAIRNSHRWISLGFVQVQPSEIAKLSYIILLAWYLPRGDHYRRLGGFLLLFVLTFVPMGLILAEPDLGTSLLFLPTLYFMLFLAGAKLRHLLGVVSVATALMFLPIPHRLSANKSAAEIKTRKALSYWHGEDYVVSAAPLAIIRHYHQIKRIEGWVRQGDPEIAADQGYQLHKSKMILGAGGLVGGTEWNGPEACFSILPDDHTDFIFSVIGGRWGLLGCLAVLFLYGVIFLFGMEIAVITHDAFGRMLVVGVMSLLLAQICINVGMTVGLMPITGMTLPLVSYGGSSLVINCAALGLLVNVGQRRKILLSRRPFEYGRKKEKPPAPYGPLEKLPNKQT